MIDQSALEQLPRRRRQSRHLLATEKSSNLFYTMFLELDNELIQVKSKCCARSACCEETDSLPSAQCDVCAFRCHRSCALSVVPPSKNMSNIVCLYCVREKSLGSATFEHRGKQRLKADDDKVVKALADSGEI